MDFSHIKTINHAAPPSIIPESKNRFTELGPTQKLMPPKIGQPGIGIGMPGLKPIPSPQIIGTSVVKQNPIIPTLSTTKPIPPGSSVVNPNQIALAKNGLLKPPILGSSANPMSHPPFTVGLNRVPPPELKSVPPPPKPLLSPLLPSITTTSAAKNGIPILPKIEPKAPVLNIHSVNESKIEKGAPINGNYPTATFLNSTTAPPPPFSFSDVEMSTVDDIKRGDALLIKNSQLYLDSMAKLFAPQCDFWTKAAERTVSEINNFNGKQAEWTRDIVRGNDNASKSMIDALGQFSSSMSESAKVLKETAFMMMDIRSDIKEFKAVKQRDEKISADITKALALAKQNNITKPVVKEKETAEPVAAAASIEVPEKEFKNKNKRIYKAGDKKEKTDKDGTDSEESGSESSGTEKKTTKRKRATKKEAEAKRKALEEQKEAKRKEKEEKALMKEAPAKSHEKIQQQATIRKKNAIDLDPNEFKDRQFKEEDRYLYAHITDNINDFINATYPDQNDPTKPLKNKKFEYIHGDEENKEAAIYRAIDFIKPYWPLPDPNQQTEEQIQQSGDALDTWTKQTQEEQQQDQQLQEEPVIVGATSEDFDGGEKPEFADETTTNEQQQQQQQAQQEEEENEHMNTVEDDPHAERIREEDEQVV